MARPPVFSVSGSRRGLLDPASCTIASGYCSGMLCHLEASLRAVRPALSVDVHERKGALAKTLNARRSSTYADRVAMQFCPHPPLFAPVEGLGDGADVSLFDRIAAVLDAGEVVGYWSGTIYLVHRVVAHIVNGLAW